MNLDFKEKKDKVILGLSATVLLLLFCLTFAIGHIVGSKKVASNIAVTSEKDLEQGTADKPEQKIEAPQRIFMSGHYSANLSGVLVQVDNRVGGYFNLEKCYATDYKESLRQNRPIKTPCEILGHGKIQNINKDHYVFQNDQGASEEILFTSDGNRAKLIHKNIEYNLVSGHKNKFLEWLELNPEVVKARELYVKAQSGRQNRPGN